MNHLTLADLIAYADPSMDEDRRGAAVEHMDTCPQCRDRFISLHTFRNAVHALEPKVEPFDLTDRCVPTELMGDFLGGRLSREEFATFSSHAAECGMCFERAAYFTHSSVKMTAGVLQMEKTPSRFIEAVTPKRAEISTSAGRLSLAELLRRWLWAPAPAYAFAASVIFFVFVFSYGGQGRVIDLNSNQTFTLYETPKQSGPSFGFSDAGRKVGETGAGLNVTRAVSGDVRFIWNAVSGAGEYFFSLSEIRPSGAIEIYDMKTPSPSVTVKAGTVTPGRAYRWKVTGAAGDDTIFAATGQFTLSD